MDEFGDGSQEENRHTRAPSIIWYETSISSLGANTYREGQAALGGSGRLDADTTFGYG